MEQSKALKLADDMIDLRAWNQKGPKLLMEQAAAELRRLSAIEAERDALRAALAASCSEERNQMLEATSGGGCSRAIAAEAECDALRAEVKRLQASPAPVAQGEPVALLWRVRRALALAMRICDRVPNRWHYTHEIGSAEADIGDMVNAHPDGTHGYREIQEAGSALVAYLTTPEAASAPVAQPAMPEGWVPLTLEWEPGYPEDVAYGPQRMMDRLKKWLDKHFAARVAESAAPAPVAQPLTDAQRLKLWHGTSSIVPMCDHYLYYARAVERACAEAWGVKLIEATGQEGGSNG